ncbi:MAG TPA: NAD(P)/FAD-dependent oxidoreductase [Dehalococcoidia bacterium]
MPNEPTVVVLGAGFGGIGAMKTLEKSPINLRLVDKNDYHTFLPLLYQVATSELSPAQVGFPAREMLHHRQEWTFEQANITGIDLGARKVLADGIDPISYDYLIVGLGAVANFFGTKGAAEHAFPLYAMRDAERLKDQIIDRFEATQRDPALIEDGSLTFAVVGGGATGVEISGALAELISEELREDYPDLPVERAEVHLFEFGPSLLAPFKAQLQKYAQKALEERGVHVHLGEGVTEIAPTRVRLHSGSEVKAHTLIWGAGIAANPIAASLGVELEKGRVPVNPDLSLPGHPEVFVIGDIAMITDAKTKAQLPQLGSVAQQAGQHAGESIDRLVHGKRTEPFEYVDKGTMATVGHGAAVVQFRRGRTMTGHAAWMTWLGVHLMLLSGGEQKALTFTDWGLEILTHKRRKRAVVA